MKKKISITEHVLLLNRPSSAMAGRSSIILVSGVNDREFISMNEANGHELIE